VGVFDVLGVLFLIEFGYINLFMVFDFVGILLYVVECIDEYLIVLVGGYVVFNFELILMFIDVVVVGDGEEVVFMIIDVICDYKVEGSLGGCEELLLRLVCIGGVYVLVFYDVDYLFDGWIKCVVFNWLGVLWWVSKYMVMDFD